LPPIPETKALLSTDGGICPEDGAAFVFDPWNPTAHRCPRCEKTFTGERHDRHWARYQHLWLAERAAHLATLAALADNAAAADRAVEILRAYTRTYWGYANQDNVLGPSRLFFSTYLESIWIGNFLAAAARLRTGRDVVLGGELPSVRAARAPDGRGVGAPRGRGHFRRAQARGAHSGGAARARAHGVARFHVPRAQGLAVRRVLGAAGVSR